MSKSTRIPKASTSEKPGATRRIRTAAEKAPVFGAIVPNGPAEPPTSDSGFAGFSSPAGISVAASFPRVLIAHSDAALLRLTRESLEAFLECDVRSTSSALSAFDRILQEPYRLLILDLHLAQLPGELLYDLISRAYPKVHPGSLTAPPVIWLGNPTDLSRQDELTREARTKALLLAPLNIQRLLDTAAGLLQRKN